MPSVAIAAASAKMSPVTCGRENPLTRRTESARPRCRDEGLDAADVVTVMVCRKDRHEFESPGLERLEHRCVVAGIHHRDGPWIACATNHPDVVVLERRDRRDVEHA